MNAAQRRIATRTTARAFPLGSAVTNDRGTVATVIGHAPRLLSVKYRNGRTGTVPAIMAR